LVHFRKNTKFQIPQFVIKERYLAESIEDFTALGIPASGMAKATNLELHQ
jgi:hypothetical protein